MNTCRGSVTTPNGYPPDACGVCGNSKGDHNVGGDSFIEAAETVAQEKVRLASAYLRFKKAGKDVTDTRAMQQAIVETGSALDVALARLEVARSRLG